jgi:ribosomal protein L22
MPDARRGIRRRRKKDEEVAAAEASKEAVEQDVAEQEADATDADAEADEQPDAKVGPEAEEAKQAAAEEEVEAESAEAEGEPEPEGEDATPAEEAKGGRRRRGSEVAPARKKTAPPPRDPDGAVAVRASAKYVRCAPRKARLVVEHIRGRSVEQARAILRNTPRAASRDVLKLLDSAIANAENNHELVADELVIRQAYVDEGPTLKRYRPRALGRATRIRKRTSHMTITLTTNDGAG